MTKTTGSLQSRSWFIQSTCERGNRKKRRKKKRKGKERKRRNEVNKEEEEGGGGRRGEVHAYDNYERLKGGFSVVVFEKMEMGREKG